MKRAKKAFIWVVAALLCIFAGLNLALPFFAKDLIVRQIEANLKLKASLGGVNITPPFSINLVDLKIGDLFQVERVSVSPNILGFFAGKIVLGTVALINPVITLEQSGAGKLNLPQLEPRGKQPPVYLTGLAVRNGRIVFNDRKVNAQGLKTIFSRVNVDISKVALPLTSLKTNFKVSGDLLKPDENKIGSLIFSGWLDFGPKDLDGVLTVRDLDLAYFSPYYGSFISSKKLLSAKLNLKSVLKAKNDDLNTLTNLRLSDLVYAKDEEGGLREASWDLSKNALDFFTDAEGNLDLEFDFSTKLSDPNLTIAQMEKIILKAAVKNLARQSPQDLIQKVNDNIEQFKSIGKGLEDLFRHKK